ncbi:MAG: hypothetical protein DRR19_24930, partial [Candidatus Parabeggiatoa sp. nov. 1]
MEKGKVITFYSYKGGVGRTMALANVAVLLSIWQYKVLIVDWDLEAPGLEYYFKDSLTLEKTFQTKGVIDLLHDFYSQSTPSFRWQDLCFEIPLPKNSVPLHFITTGKRDDDYFDKVRGLDVPDFYSQKKGGFFIESLRSEWKQEYDFILLDSRTGITDFAGICTIQLPDILILFLTAIEQSLDGIIKVAKKANSARQELPFDRLSTLSSLPILCKFEIKEERERGQKWLDDCINNTKLPEIYTDWLPSSIDLVKFIEKTYIPYVPYFSFGENLPVLEKDADDPRGLGYAYKIIAALIAHELNSVEQLMDSPSEFVKAASEKKFYRSDSDDFELVFFSADSDDFESESAPSLFAEDIHSYSEEQLRTLQFETAFDLKLSTFFKDEIKGGGYAPEMAVIPAGRFMMGSSEIEQGRETHEGPQHEVTIAKPFALGIYVVTIAEYIDFCHKTGRTHSMSGYHSELANHPITNVSWEQAVAFANWISDQTRQKYRLPTEAEWEYAARAGT